MREFLASFLITAVIGFAVIGCTSNPSSTLDRLGVQVATMALIERADNPADKAIRVLEAVAKARTVLDMAEVSVSDIRVALLTRVAERNLSPLEKLAALEAINAVSNEVESRLGKGLLSPEQRVDVNTVLSQIEGAARTYVPQ